MDRFNLLCFLDVRQRIVVSHGYDLSSFICEDGRNLGTLSRRNAQGLLQGGLILGPPVCAWSRYAAGDL